MSCLSESCHPLHLTIRGNRFHSSLLFTRYSKRKWTDIVRWNDCDQGNHSGFLLIRATQYWKKLTWQNLFFSVKYNAIWKNTPLHTRAYATILVAVWSPVIREADLQFVCVNGKNSMCVTLFLIQHLLKLWLERCVSFCHSCTCFLSHCFASAKCSLVFEA